MEFKRIWLPYNTNPEIGDAYISCRPLDNEQTIKAENELKDLISDGWKIISTSPLVGSVVFTKPTAAPLVFTTGIEVFLMK
jgi:hypothetical protein